MKRFLLLFSLMVLFSCQPGRFRFNLKGETAQLDEKKIYRVEIGQNNQPHKVDSTLVKNGTFVLKGEASQPDINFLQIEGISGGFPFIVEAGNIKATLYKDSLDASRISGTISNDDLMRYKKDTEAYMKALADIGGDMQKSMIMKDSLSFSDLKEQATEIQQKVRDYEMAFVNSNRNSFISALILERIVASKSLPLDSIRPIYEQFSSRIKNSKPAESIVKELNNPTKPVKIGQLAPMFEAPDPNGNKLSLKEKLGKITIVNFWASWCRPCREENTTLVRLYNRFHADGLEIVSVSLDKDKSSWIKAIEDDGLQWNHVSSLKFWNEPVAKLYSVTSTPMAFILDENGKIIARDLRGDELEKEVAKLLSKDKG